MATCGTCGAEVGDDFAFCPRCGAALQARAEPSREQRKVVTVLFCDVTGSTELGEQLDPEALRALLARYFERMKAIIERHGGSVEKFIGDAVMAVFGVPVVHEDDAFRAVRAAVEMRDAFSTLGCQGRIGVTTGEVVTGTSERLATGDAVNLAARLEQAASPGEILIGASTLGLTRDAVDVEELPPLALKGKAESVAAFRLVSVRGDEPVTRRLDRPMVGREPQLERLRSAFEQAVRDRSCQLFTILGAAGVGKSRLALEFLSGRADALVLRGRCLPYGDGITYWPVIEVAKQLPAAALEGNGTATIAALLRDELVASSREEIAWAFRSLLESVAVERPLVCVFDDIHWGEETFLDLVEHVADLSRDAPILLLCMARPELLDRRPGWAGGKVNATTVLLEALAPEETDAMIESLGHLDESLVARIREAAEGNPLYVEQMVALVQESGNGDVAVPPTIQALLAARLDQLDPAERAVLERGSIEGRVFHRGAVEALAPDDAAVATRLTSLVRKELVRPDKPVFSGDDAFRFRHLLIRDAAYDALAKSTRAELHTRFASWLETHGQDLVELDEILGYHLEQAYSYRRLVGLVDENDAPLGARAATYLEASGRRAAVRGDAPAAGRFFERAAALLPTEDPDRLALLTSLGAALIEVGEWDRARDALSEARATAEHVGDPGAAAHASIRLAWLDIHQDPEASHAKVRAELERAIVVFEGLGDKSGLARALDMAGMLRMWGGENARAKEEMELAAQYAREAGDRVQEIQALSGVVMALVWGPDPVAAALKRIEEIARQSEGAARLQAAALRGRALLQAMAGNLGEARELITTAERIARELGLETLRAGGILRLAGQIELIAGDAPAAERFLREAYESLHRSKDWGHLSSVAPLLAEALLAQGLEDEAETLLELTSGWVIADDTEGHILLACARSKLAELRGDAEGAESFARAAVERSAMSDNGIERPSALLRLAEALELGNRGEDASAALHEALLAYERKGDVVGAERVRQRLGDS
jgi:class 3 adenylate cyclase/tetratricopeptide (TPR) repeat protein